MKRFFQYASLLLAAVMLISCEGTTGSTDAGKTLKLTSDKNLIQTFGGDYATLTVTLDGQKIVEDVLFFDENNELIDIADFKFSATEVGEYSIWANYGTYTSETITIRAIDIQIPSTPADPKPASTDFKTRALITEFTTVGCSACPSMKEVLHTIEEDTALADMAICAEAHTGLINSVADPCYLHNRAFEDFCVITGFPTVKLDLASTYNNGNRFDIKEDLQEVVAAKEAFAPGIAVNSVLKDGKVVAKVTVKAKVAASYRVGTYLVEDGIYAKQYSATADYMHTHDNVIRYIDAQYKGSFYGIPVAEIAEGKTGDAVFSWFLDENWETGSNMGEINGGIAWPERKDENLHLIVFVTMSDGQGGYVVANAIDCPINGETKFEYR